jgi:hypothetical protein
MQYYIRAYRRSTHELTCHPPLQDIHPLVANVTACRACGQFFRAGDLTTLVPLGPGDDPEQRKRARDGRPYTAGAIPTHWACATGLETAPV